MVTVCRDRECTRTAFPLEVRPANTAPTASVELSSSDAPAVWPTSTLTAPAVGADAEADGVTLRYQWYINGGGLPLPDTTTSVDISPWAAPGDVVEVRVTPKDGTTDGNVARAEVTVQTPPVPPAMPTITASGRVGDADYLAGERSTAPVPGQPLGRHVIHRHVHGQLSSGSGRSIRPRT